jgi:hypothetical protein
MKKVAGALVIGCALSAFITSRSADTAAQSSGAVFVGIAGAKCGAMIDSAMQRADLAEELKYWEQGFVDGALMAQRQTASPDNSRMST